MNACTIPATFMVAGIVPALPGIYCISLATLLVGAGEGDQPFFGWAGWTARRVAAAFASVAGGDWCITVFYVAGSWKHSDGRQAAVAAGSKPR